MKEPKGVAVGFGTGYYWAARCSNRECGNPLNVASCNRHDMEKPTAEALRPMTCILCGTETNVTEGSLYFLKVGYPE